MKWVCIVTSILLVFAVSESNGKSDADEADKSQPTITQQNAESGADAEVESDMVAIESLWHSLQMALLANDPQFVLQHFTPSSRERYTQLFELMGPAMSKMPGTWSDFTAIEIGPQIAMYAFTQKETNGDRLHTVSFVRHPRYGWLIQSM